MLLPLFPKICMKSRKFWSVGQGRMQGAPLDPPLHWSSRAFDILQFSLKRLGFLIHVAKIFSAYKPVCTCHTRVVAPVG